MIFIKKAIVIVIILFFAIMSSQIYFSYAADETSITISGFAKDSDGNLLPEIKVYLIDSKGNVVKDSTTDENGKYSFDNVSKGEYKLKFEYQSNYEKPEITLQDAYTGKVEIAYLYDNSHSSSKEELEKMLNEQLDNEVNNQIIRSHSSKDELLSHITELGIDSNNSNAFQKINISGYKGVLIINSDLDITEDEIKSISASYIYYKCAILNTNDANEIINKIIELLNGTDQNAQTITNDNSIQDTSVESNQIDIQSSSIINLTIEKREEDIVNQLETDDNIVLVKGNIYANDNILSGTPVRVSLVDANSKQMNSYIVYDGQYEFKYPIDGGTFFIHFEINCGKYNGQDYELDSQDRKIYDEGNIEQNVGSISNIEDIKNNFKDITIEKEDEIFQTESATKLSEASKSTKLIIQTDSFDLRTSK